MKFAVISLSGLTAVAAFTPSAFMGKTAVSRSAVKSSSTLDMKYTVAVVGGGPSGACAAEIFAQEKGINTFMFERKLDNAKPCGGAIPLCMIGEFDMPETVVDRKVSLIISITHVELLSYPCRVLGMLLLQGKSVARLERRLPFFSLGLLSAIFLNDTCTTTK